ncbi:MAG: hypothetical protein INR70_09160, partial [Parafilimonas terrae]|nr:hypothetical protein [Parafilimonas terrae]
PPDIVEALVESAWWDRPASEVGRLVPLLQSGRIEDLLSALRSPVESLNGEAPPAPRAATDMEAGPRR